MESKMSRLRLRTAAESIYRGPTTNSRCKNAVPGYWLPLLLLLSPLTAAAQMPDKPLTRPRITGISHIAVYTSNLDGHRSLLPGDHRRGKEGRSGEPQRRALCAQRHAVH